MLETCIDSPHAESLFLAHIVEHGIQRSFHCRNHSEWDELRRVWLNTVLHKNKTIFRRFIVTSRNIGQLWVRERVKWWMSEVEQSSQRKTRWTEGDIEQWNLDWRRECFRGKWKMNAQPITTRENREEMGGVMIENLSRSDGETRSEWVLTGVE